MPTRGRQFLRVPLPPSSPRNFVEASLASGQCCCGPLPARPCKGAWKAAKA
nr:MAG TPA: hypothetical protein [Caudoviricetes sp.]